MLSELNRVGFNYSNVRPSFRWCGSVTCHAARHVCYVGGSISRVLVYLTLYFSIVVGLVMRDVGIGRLTTPVLSLMYVF